MSVNYRQFFADLETRMSLIQENAYTDALENAWWKDVATTRPTATKNEVVNWILSSAQFSKLSEGITFTDQSSEKVELIAEDYLTGQELLKSQVDDFAFGMAGGEAASLAADWIASASSVAALLPQQLMATAIRDNVTAYDGLSYFNTAHLLHPRRSEVGTYSNDLVGASYGIDDTSSDTDVKKSAAFAKALGKVAEIKTPDGQLSRNLKVVGLLFPPALMRAAEIVTGAKFINATDMQGFVSKNGIKPVMAPELAAGFSGGSDSTYYLVCRTSGSQIGAFVHVDRQPFLVNYASVDHSAEMARNRKVQYVGEVRTGIVPAHPYGLIRVRIA